MQLLSARMVEPVAQQILELVFAPNSHSNRSPQSQGVESCLYYLPALLDNSPSSFHPQTQERCFDLLQLPEVLAVEAIEIVEGRQLLLSFSNFPATHRFEADWLYRHQPGRSRPDPALDNLAVTAQAWLAQDWTKARPVHDAASILSSDAALLAWLEDMAKFGLTLVNHMPTYPGALETLAQRIGFLRPTNFGLTFEVQSVPNPNNLAYTSLALPFHTDLPNQEVPPGLQFLHCIANEAQGGESIFADGLALSIALRAQDAQAFEVLSQVDVPFRFHDNEHDIRVRSPILCLDAKGQFSELRYNAHILDQTDMPLATLQRWYPAYKALMRLSRQEAYRLDFKLEAGQMVCFDNRRVLHGRSAFEPQTGARHLRGCYVDRGEFLSRLRMLKQKESDTALQG